MTTVESGESVESSVELLRTIAAVLDIRAVFPQFETRVSGMQVNAEIHPSLGNGPMILAPDVKAGNYFNSQDRTGRRVDWLSTYAFAPFGPNHRRGRRAIRLRFVYG